MRQSDFHHLCQALLATRVEIANARVMQMRPGHSRQLAQLLINRAHEKRSAICALLRPEIRLRVDAMKAGRPYSIYPRRGRRHG